jgi:chromosome segregation ATPase
VIDRKELELLVRAQIQGGKDLDAVARSISKIGEAIDEQSAAAKKGEARIDELRASLESIALVQKELEGQQRAIRAFEKLAKGVAAADERLASATKRHNEYAVGLEKVEKRTEAQQDRLVRYAAAVDKAAAALARQKGSLASMEAEFRAAGIEVESLAAVQQRNVALQGELGLVYAKGSQAVKGYTSDVRAAREAQAALDRQNAESIKNAELFARAEQRAADAARARARAAEEVEQARANRRAEVASQRRFDQEVAEQRRRQEELTALRRDIEGRTAQANSAKEAAGYQKVAAAARTQAREFTTLARAADNLAPKTLSVRDAVDSIIKPAKSATQSIDKLEAEIKQLAQGAQSIRGPISDYRSQIERLSAAQNTLGRQAGLIDTFNRQIALLRQSRAEFVQSRADVARYAAEVARGGDSAREFGTKLAQAQAQMRASAQAMASQIGATRQSREALQAAGLSTRNLAGEQQRLTALSRQSVAAMDALKQANERYGTSVRSVSQANDQLKRSTEGAARAKWFFRDEGRTTLSLVQRIRGEILSLAAAYVGLYSAINVGRGAIQATIDRQAIESRIAVAIDSNDPEKIGRQYEYLRDRADYYGIGLKGLAQSYGSYAVATRSARYSDEQTRYTFEQLTAAMRVMKLNTDQSGRAFVQIQQILSKTKPEMEDIKTIAESGFAGVQGLMARGLRTIGVEGIRAGTEVGDMFALMKKGALDSNRAIFALAVQAEQELGGRIPEAIKTLAAEQGRFETSVFEFQQKVAESGWAEAYKQALVEIGDLLASPEGVEGAKALGQLFASLARGAVWLANNLDTVKNVLILVGLYMARIPLMNAYRDTVALVGVLKSLGAVFTATVMPAIRAAVLSLMIMVNTMGVLAKGVLSALGVIGAGFAGWQIGKWAYEKFAIVRKAGVWLVTGLAEAWAVMTTGFQAAAESLPAFMRQAFVNVINIITAGVRKSLGIFARLASAAGFDDLSKNLSGIAQSMKLTAAGTEGIYAKHRANLEAERARIRQIRADMLADASGVAKVAAQAEKEAARAVSGAIAGRPDTPINPLDIGGDKGASKRISDLEREIDQLDNALKGLETRALKQDADTLDKQIALIDREYGELAARIGKIGGDTGTEFMRRLNAARNALIDNVTNDFNAKMLAAQNAFLKKTEDAEEQAGKRDKLRLDSRLNAIRSDYEQLYRELNDLRAQFVANGRDTGPLDEAAQRLEAARALRLELETTKYNTEELNRREQLLNDTIAAREKLISAVNTQRQLGYINDQEAGEQMKRINDEMLPKIEAAGEATRQWAVAHQAIFSSPEQMQVFLATLDAVLSKARGVKNEFSLINDQIAQAGVNAINGGLSSVYDSLMKVFNGQLTVKEGFDQMMASLGEFARAFLKEIVVMIAKMYLFRSLQGMGGFLGSIGTAGLNSMGAGVRHSGGVIGRAGGSRRQVDPSWFANAPRYHSDGLAGLRSDEYATILQRGEEVLTRDNPRHVMNSEKGSAGFGGALTVTMDPSALGMTMRDWLEREMGRIAATQ